MPVYVVKCQKCGETQEVYIGKVVNDKFINIPCRKCNYYQVKKIPSPINNARFTDTSSRRSVNTRTGVGEIQFKQGAKKIINEANN